MAEISPELSAIGDQQQQQQQQFTVESLFNRRIDVIPSKKKYSPISSSGGFYLETLNPDVAPLSGLATAVKPAGDAAAPPTKTKRSDGSDFYDPDLSFRITFRIRKIGAGLANLGNTCFLNAVLQCLTYTEPFVAYLQSGKHKSSCHTAGFCAMCALHNHVMIALQSTGKILTPSHLVKNLRCISRNFRNSRQEDAHEYMVNLLESMHKCCLPSGVPSQSPSAYEKSFVHKIFGGRLRSQVKCTQCSYCSNKFDPFLDLSLEINKADSLRKALTHFTNWEQLDGGEKQYQCQRCKQKVRALKQLTINKAPYVLTIHLKRFGSFLSGHKIDKMVEFGATLDLTPYVSDPQEGNLTYTLYGVLVHAGWSTHSGHYYCFVRTSSGMWHNLDDNQVRQVSEKTVFQQKAYMLFYVRDKVPAVTKPLEVVEGESYAADFSNHFLKSPSLVNGSPFDILVDKKNSSLKHNSQITATSLGQLNSVIGSSAQISLQKEADSLDKEAKEGSISKSMSHDVTSLKFSKNIAEKKMQEHNALSGSSEKVSSAHDSMKNISGAFVSQKLTADSVEAMSEKDTLLTGSQSKALSILSGAGLINGCNKSGGPELQIRSKMNKPDSMNKDLDKPSTDKNGHVDTKKKKQDTSNTMMPLNLRNENGEVNVKHQEGSEATLKVDNNGFAIGAPCKEVPILISKESLVRRKKLTKTARIVGMSFSYKHLFMRSFGVRKSKQHKKHRKKSLKSNLLKQGKSPNNNDNEASTSEVFGGCDTDPKASRKRLRPKSDKKACIQGNKNVKLDVTDSLKVNDIAREDTVFGNPVTEVATGHHQDSRETNVSEGTPDRDDFMSILTRGLRKASGWGSGLPLFEDDQMQDSSIKTIGYVLDEWDEEYDRGKRKKVRKSSQTFGGPNIFQEVASIKAQEKIRGKVSSNSNLWNKPFRI